MKQVLGIFVSFLFSISAWGFPEAPFDGLEQETRIEISEAFADFDFNGIVGLSNCSAAIVHFTGQPKTSQAYVLTNGHCISSWGGFLRPGEVVSQRPDSRSMSVFKDIDNRIRVSANTLVYATMTNTDAALYRLNTTYAELEAQGIMSFELSFEAPDVGQPIHIVSGYWKRGFECQVDGIVYQLREADWTFQDSIRYSSAGCEVYGGTSGSPVIAQNERVVVGVNNTGNESGQECTMNNPCEVNRDGSKTVIRGRGYAQQTYWFYSCLNEGFEIDLNREGCLLPKGR